MKITIHIDYSVYFGDLANSWKQLFESAGHQVRIQEMGSNPHYSEFEKSDINLIVVGMIMLQILASKGFPENGKNILWVFEPLYPSSIMHYEKYLYFKMIPPKFDKVICMNQDIQDFIKQTNRKVKTCIVPYNISSKRIIKPTPENEKFVDIVLIGRNSPKRNDLTRKMHDNQLNILNITGGCYQKQRSALLSNTKISLQVGLDNSKYFDQYRIFESIAHGCLVITEPIDDIENFGFFDRKNIIISELDKIPMVCKELLYNPEYRSILIKEAQDTLRKMYCSDIFLEKLLKFISSR